MTPFLILAAAASLLVGLLFFEKRDSIRGLLLTKPVLSALFVATALSGLQPDPGYFHWILAGRSPLPVRCCSTSRISSSPASGL
jgi:hypothetical protein